MAEIRQVVSEQLQATIRRLLPSQQGFTEDLQASNVITPIIDLTPSAEGSSIPSFLQQAISFDDATTFDITNTTSNIVSSTGFWRVIGSAQIESDGSNVKRAGLQITDGLATKIVWQVTNGLTFSGNKNYNAAFDLIIFLTAGDTLQGTCAATRGTIAGSVRQIADISGNLVNPTGFSSS